MSSSFVRGGILDELDGPGESDSELESDSSEPEDEWMEGLRIGELEPVSAGILCDVTFKASRVESLESMSDDETSTLERS